MAQMSSAARSTPSIAVKDRLFKFLPFYNNNSFCFRNFVLFGFFTSLFIILLASTCTFYTPLPQNLTQREKMVAFDVVARFIYYYPVKIFNYFGFFDLHVNYSRLILHNVAFLANRIGENFGKRKANSEIKRVFDLKLGHVPVRIYIPKMRLNNGAIFFVHGGGYVLFNVETYDHVARQISVASGTIVISVDYRLAPEYLFPTALQDCEHALLSFMKDYSHRFSVDPGKIIVMGDSAGGAVAAVLARKFKAPDENVPFALKAQILVYPVTQMIDLLTPSYCYANNFTRGTALLDPEMVTIWMLLYLGLSPYVSTRLLANDHHVEIDKNVQLLQLISDHLNHAHLPFANNTKCESTKFDSKEMMDYDFIFTKLFDPDFSPLIAPSGSLIGSPKALVMTCEYDPLRDDGFWYYRRLRNEKVDVKWIHYDQGFHGMMNAFDDILLAQKLVTDAATFVKETLND